MGSVPTWGGGNGTGAVGRRDGDGAVGRGQWGGGVGRRDSGVSAVGTERQGWGKWGLSSGDGSGAAEGRGRGGGGGAVGQSGGVRLWGRAGCGSHGGGPLAVPPSLSIPRLRAVPIPRCHGNHAVAGRSLARPRIPAPPEPWAVPMGPGDAAQPHCSAPHGCGPQPHCVASSPTSLPPSSPRRPYSHGIVPSPAVPPPAPLRCP